MAILFAGSEPEDFLCVGGTVDRATNSTRWRASSGSRLAFRSSSTDTQAYSETPLFPTAVSELWVNHYRTREGAVASVITGPFMSFISGGVEVLRLWHNSSTPVFILERWNGSAWVALQSWARPGVWPGQAAIYEMTVYLKVGASGSFVVYLNGAEQMRYTGLIDVGNIERLRIGNEGLSNITEVVVATEPTFNWIVRPRRPSAAGATAAWTGATFGNVSDSSSTSDGTAMSSSTADQQASFAVPALTLSSGGVKGVVQIMRAQTNGVAPTRVRHRLRLATTNYDSADLSPGLALGPVQRVLDLNPATGLPWTNAQASVSTMQIGAVSRP